MQAGPAGLCQRGSFPPFSHDPTGSVVRGRGLSLPGFFLNHPLRRPNRRRKTAAPPPPSKKLRRVDESVE